MRKLSCAVPTGNRAISRKIAMAIVSTVTCGACLWLGVTGMRTSSIPVAPPSSIFTAETVSNQRTNRNTNVEWGEQIVITHRESTRAAREAAAFQQFQREIAMATQGLENSDSTVDEVVGRLTSLKACLVYTYLMVKDFFTGGSEVDTICNAETEKLDVNRRGIMTPL